MEKFKPNQEVCQALYELIDKPMYGHDIIVEMLERVELTNSLDTGKTLKYMVDKGYIFKEPGQPYKPNPFVVKPEGLDW